MLTISSKQLRGLGLAVFLFAGAGCQPNDQAATQTPTANPTQPNFLVILADDLGYTDLGYFGSEISTPNIDDLANNGLVLTNYYSAPLCAATRAELMSGTDHHIAGEGLMDVNVDGYDGYAGRLNDKVVSLATRLQGNGYNTFMTGKWHIGRNAGQRPASRGFDQSYIMTPGGSMHFAEGVDGLMRMGKVYFDNDQVVNELPEDFYSTDFFTDKMIEYIDGGRDSGKPFFAYLAYTSPHWPLQAHDEDIAAQKGRYDEGYGVLRQKRFEAWKDIGMGKASDELPNLPDDYTAWENLSEDEKAISRRTMETYAAMVENLDRGIGQVLSYLKETGQLDNTVVIFQSDNGAEASPGYAILGQGADNSLENIGRVGSFVFLKQGWAEAGSAPFRQNKTYTTEGGVRVPAMIYGPKFGIEPRRDDAVIMTYDIAPTLLDLAGISYDKVEEGKLPITGRSFVELLKGQEFKQRRGPNDVIGREHAGHGAIRKGDWKLTWENKERFWTGRMPKEGEPWANSGDPIAVDRLNKGSPAGDPIGEGGPWRLFNLANDPAEKYDLAKSEPEKFAEMMHEWENYVETHNIVVKSGQP